MRIVKVTPIGSDQPRVHLRFGTGPFDPILRDPALQQELRDIEEDISRDDPGVQSQVGLQKSADVGSWLTGQYGVALGAVGSTLDLILVNWLKAGAERKIKLKVGDTEVEARTSEEVEDLLSIALAYKNEQAKADKE